MNHKQGIDRNQIQMLSLEELVAADSFARVIDVLVDLLPLAELGFKNVRLNDQGNEPYHPSELLKLMLYGQRHGIRSARKLEHQCLINLEIKWLIKDLRPSSRTICYFRVENATAIKKAHRHFVRKLKSWNLISGEILALDSTKMRGQNSLKNNFNQKKIDRHLEYIDQKVEDYLDTIKHLKNKRNKIKEIREIEEKKEKLLERREKYERLQEAVDCSADGQVSTTDPDCRAVIKHRNIVEVGYNVQTMVDAKNQMIVDVYAGGVTDRSDLATASKRSQDLLEVEKIDLLADAGYHNGADIAYCERKGIRTFIPPSRQHYQKQEGFRKKDFEYDEKSDTYKCPAGKRLKREITYKKQNSKRKYRVHRYGTGSCSGCRLRTACTKARAGRKIERPAHQKSRQRNDKRVKRYSDFYRLRQQIVEPVFGIWKRQWNFDHVTLRTREKVEAELTLAALAYNILRLVNIKGIEWLKKRVKKGKKANFRYMKQDQLRYQREKIISIFHSQGLRSMRIAKMAG